MIDMKNHIFDYRMYLVLANTSIQTEKTYISSLKNYLGFCNSNDLTNVFDQE